MLRYTYTSGSLYCCTSGHVTLSKITLSHHGVGVDIITLANSETMKNQSLGSLFFETAWHVLTASCLVCLKLSNVKSGIHNLLDVCI